MFESQNQRWISHFVEIAQRQNLSLQQKKDGEKKNWELYLLLFSFPMFLLRLKKFGFFLFIFYVFIVYLCFE